MSDYDLVVIGGGAAGLGAARAGVQRGARTLLVTEGPPGGECTFTGCVPSKTLIEAAYAGLPHTEAQARVHAAIARIAATEDQAALESESIQVRRGRARFTARNRIDVDGHTIAGARFVIATGAAPTIPPIPGLADAPYLTHETVFALPTLPASLVVLGGGSIGCEIAQAYARLGSNVTIIESADRLLPREDPEAAAVLTAVFAADGIHARTGVRVTRIGSAPGGVGIDLSDGDLILAEKLLVAAGRLPVTGGLGLDTAGIQVDEHGAIAADEHLATTAAGVYAAGDVTAKMPYTPAAFAQGRLAAANALARRPWQRRRYRPHGTPRVTFTRPEIAHAGAFEADTPPGTRVAFLPMAEMDRAITADATDGFIKLLAAPRPLWGNLGGGRIIGATIVAHRAGEMIHEPVMAMATGMFAGRLAATTHAYPTWSYGIQLAAAQFFQTLGGRTAHPARTRAR